MTLANSRVRDTQDIRVTRMTLDPTPDADGEPTYSTTTKTYRGRAWPTSSEERLDDVLGQIDYRAALPDYADVSQGDSVQIKGEDFEVIGPPILRESPLRQYANHLAVNLRRSV